MNHVDFVSAPKIGHGLLLDEQRYELVLIEPYTRRDGTKSVILTWQSDCPRCGMIFTVTSGLVTKALNRRCEHCRKIAYRPVSGKKRSEKIRVRSEPA